MAWQQSDLDAIDKALASNVRSVTYSDGRRVDYQDADKMLAVRKEIKADLTAQATSLSPRLRTTVGRMCRR
jgi:hypothetical protein